METRVILTDIEGTTTPITFVKDTLFPFVLAYVEQFLQQHWHDYEIQKLLVDLKNQADVDVENGMDYIERIPEIPLKYDYKVCKAVVDNVKAQMERDRKIGPLKALQGQMWKDGYENGSLVGVVYDDVPGSLEAFRKRGLKVYVYSSGSVLAQKLIFGYSNHGNLLALFDGHFDTTIGNKLESQSYTRIASELDIEPNKILFLTDNILEIEAALKAGMQVSLAIRPVQVDRSSLLAVRDNPFIKSDMATSNDVKKLMIPRRIIHEKLMDNPFISNDQKSQLNTLSHTTIYPSSISYKLTQNPFIKNDLNLKLKHGKTKMMTKEDLQIDLPLETVELPWFSMKQCETPEPKESYVTVSLRSTVIENETDLESIHMMRKMLLDKMVVEVSDEVKNLIEM